MIFIETKELLEEFFKKNGSLAVGSKLINVDNLKILRKKQDLQSLPNEYGCYFIFSTLSPEKVPCFNDDGYKCFENELSHIDGVFRCIYGGKGGKIRGRVSKHLFSNHTLLKIKNGVNEKVSSTGSLSLAYVTSKEVSDFKIEKNNLKPFGKSVKKISKVQDANGVYFLNGINVEEESWSGVLFGVIAITTDSELGKILIEQAFVQENGMPPLCKRFG